jgi:hypothetical protein
MKSPLLWLAALTVLALGLPRVATAQETVYRFVIDFDVTCHAAPDLASKSGRTVAIAGNLSVGRVVETGGTTWYSLSRDPSCWLHGPSTIASSGTDVLPSWLAMVDYQLRRQSVTWEQYVELENLLANPARRNRFGHQRLAASGLLRFKMLELLEQALAHAQRTAENIDADPFKRAWLIAHDASVFYYEPGGVWLVPGTTYWEIYEQNKGAAWAEEVAWVASQHHPATDACETDCVLDSQLIEGPLQYWKRYPNGPHIAEALRNAADRAKVAGSCSGLETTRELVDQIRTSLAKVTHSEKRQVLKFLKELERPCSR